MVRLRFRFKFRFRFRCKCDEGVVRGTMREREIGRKGQRDVT